MNNVFVVLQKYTSFDLFAGNNNLIPEAAKEHIRWNFKKNNQTYNLTISLSPCDAYKFIKPITDDGSIVRWWDYNLMDI